MKTKLKQFIIWTSKAMIIFSFIFFTLVMITKLQYQEVNDFFTNVEPKIESMLEKVSCEIDYKDLHYKGLCLENDMVWDFLREQNNMTYENTLYKAKMIEALQDRNDCNFQKSQLIEFLEIQTDNLNECRDIQIDCVDDCFGEVPRVNRQ